MFLMFCFGGFLVFFFLTYRNDPLNYHYYFFLFFFFLTMTEIFIHENKKLPWKLLIQMNV